MDIHGLLEYVDVAMRQWCQPKVDRLDRDELTEYRALCDMVSAIRNSVRKSENKY